ncbi:MAG: hypothetical protein ABI723_24065 [Bacteroidia bacterium]
MQLTVKGSFHRDWKKIQNRALNNAILKRISEMEKATDLSQISHFKKLRKYSSTYKTEIVSGRKIYWMLCFIYSNEIYLVRLKPESYFKKYLR